MEKQQINNRIEEIVKAHGFILVDLVLRGDNHLRIIEVFIDGEKGITAVDCANVSRDLTEVIDSEKLVESNYRLDVSSPGAERPLKFLVQYFKHINRKFEIEYLEEGEKKLTAKLLRIEDENLIFAVKDAEYKIDFKSVTKAKVLISF
jgi:ribosome maturation factor RimP